ncbi:GNAT family N-acetyltransferase [Capnocytophaga canimorsus]|uniref:Protein GTLF3B n=1 Tax=Capnocytophaga canimorsus (strain 5) TaxID=860228 RepID=F9YQ20_CAPCC|nr:N-acetyltransferase [Capnocytophaga canimorsus]AEK23439.1 Protein GTLF3B [Capnocytophaga canimorsus Cc5]WGU67999.1 N-acetyltransferase [Capnocytophaga canimorsus]WGU70901.1 N-acetyltransferase [Capnocytophaga canimorsus]VEJ18522.1 Uncharacterised protein [Capnocytophaga canimorsus]
MIPLKNNEFLRQFHAQINEEVAFIEYAIQEKKIFLTKMHIPEKAPKTFEEAFIKSVLEEANNRRLKVVPTCPPIVSFFRKNKEYKDLLPVGIRI